MQLSETRIARIAVARRQVALAEDVLPQAGKALETAAYFCVLCAFWALIVFVAMTAALQ